MFYGATHIDIPVSDLDRATTFWVEVVGFTVAKRQEGYVDIDGGNIKLRLTATDHVVHPLTIRISAGDVQAAFDTLVNEGLEPIFEPMQNSELEQVGAARDPDGHRLVVWRELTEDEHGVIPELPTVLTWPPECEEFLQRLLKHVPVLFRALARKKGTRSIEDLARAEGVPIDRDILIRGYIMSAPKFMRSNMVGPMATEGVNAADYQDAFDAE